MPDFHFEPLSYLDRSFLALESRTTHMHVAAVAVFGANELGDDQGGVNFSRVRDHIRSKLHYIPVIASASNGSLSPAHRSGWTTATSHLDYHVRHTGLPRPGSEDQLKRLAGRIVSQQLDRSKPLWELWVVEGLADGRFALIAKIHHCMIDGLSGVDLTTILLNPEATSHIEKTTPWMPRRGRTPTELAGAHAARVMRRNLERFGSAKELASEGRQGMGREPGPDRPGLLALGLAVDQLGPLLSTPRSGRIAASTGPRRRFPTSRRSRKPGEARSTTPSSPWWQAPCASSSSNLATFGWTVCSSGR